jgi:hypothetical protein
LDRIEWVLIAIKHPLLVLKFVIIVFFDCKLTL